MNAFIILISRVIDIYIFLLIANVVLSWLITFNVLNTHNRFVFLIGDFLNRITEPALAPIKRLIPTFGGVDISPVVLVLGLYFLKDLMFEYLLRI